VVRGGQRSTLGAEADGKRQSIVGGRSVTVAGTGENDFSFRPTTRGDDARGGGCIRCAWSGHGGRSTVLA
jgi:hypothetical protein